MDVHSAISDGTLRRLVDDGRLEVDPWDPDMVQPASIDLRLGDSFRVFSNHRITAIDLREVPPNLTEEVTIGPASRSSSIRASSASAARWSASSCPTTSWPASRASRASAASG